MQKCKRCGKVSVAYDPVRLEWRCLWNACRYTVTEKSTTNGTHKKTEHAANGQVRRTKGGQVWAAPG